MGRSVSYANGSLLIAYTTFEADEDDWEAFDFYIEDIQQVGQSLWPSFEPCDEWLGREDHAVLENGLGYIGISEYCGLVSIWFAPKPNSYEYSDTHNREDLARGFAKRIEKKFHESFGTLRQMGRFSNGEAVFERIEREAA